ncbi:MAG: ribosomal subunit interface protein [Deltaproteobacteria bacterium GWA2_50_8]|nr:MAG: ribosomal subunit interface protein [Deltaproteobacteria bacterium GWA2_50_8]
MNIDVTFRHLDASDAVKTHVFEKMERIKKYLIKPEHVHVILTVENHHNKINNIVEIILSENGNRLSANERGENMYASIDMAVGKIERQLKKYKEKTKNHKVINNTKTFT